MMNVELKEEPKTEKENQKKSKPFWKKDWIKGMGAGAFIFFFVKGLVWLAVFFGLTKAIGC